MLELNKDIPPRLFVIEMSVKIEHFLNEIICQLLQVKAEDSKSFGNSSQSLSFNAKANLLLDLDYLDKDQIKKFQIFMEVRNKFAHLYSVDTFEKCFALTKNYNQLKKLFEVDKEGDNLEEDMTYMFISLSLDLANTLKELRERIFKEMAVKYTQRRFTEVIKSSKGDFIKAHPDKSEAVEDFMDYLKAILIDEVDEKIKNKNPPHI
ncbi:hypothetical protein [uncultured Fluviicola sp.]|uniref:hypothetical protein n=1 Tax=uncultured Fluviicola sp. TaxID=463303 RepID=UPI0025F1778A|nr:hypothetical protein [uncultured Fluviicola sp.]